MLGSSLCFPGFWTPLKTLFHLEYFRGTPSGLLPHMQLLFIENLMCLGSGRFLVSCLSTAPGSWKSKVPLADLSQVSPLFVATSSALTGSERLRFYGLCILFGLKTTVSSHFPLSNQTDILHVSYLLFSLILSLSWFLLYSEQSYTNISSFVTSQLLSCSLVLYHTWKYTRVYVFVFFCF